MDQARRWVIKYFSCLLGNAVVQPGSRSRHSSDSSVASSFVCLCAGWRWTFWTLFLVTHCPYADLLTNLMLMCELTLQIILLC